MKFSDIQEWEDKPWGRVAHAPVSPCCIISYLETKAGGFSSIHLHRSKSNLFIVITGIIRVRCFGVNESEIILEAGDTAAINAGIYHCFEVIESGLVVEVYCPKVVGTSIDLNDIVRLNQGGFREIERAVHE